MPISSNTSATNLFDNGDAELNPLNPWSWSVFRNLRGWSVLSGAGVEVQKNAIVGVVAKSGDSMIELDSSGGNSNSAAYQDIATGAGNKFVVKFSYYARVTWIAGTDTNDIEVWWENQYLGRISHDKGGWQDYQFEVSATSASSRLTFKATGLQDNYGGLLDAVGVFRAEDSLYTRNLVGTDAKDNLQGSAGADYINGAGNNDAIYGGGGNDILQGGTGDDTIFGDKAIDYSNNRIANGSFESVQMGGAWGTFANMSGWQRKWGYFELQNNRLGITQASEGFNYLELDANGNAAIFQDINSTNGEKISLQFEYRARVWHANSNAIEVWINDAYYATINESAPGAWKTYSYEITATGAKTRIEFRGAGQNDTMGGFIDNVRAFGITDTSGDDIIRGGEGLDNIQAGAGDDQIILVGETEVAYYTQSHINNSGGTGTNLSSVLSAEILNNHSVSDAVAGETINGGAGNDTLHIFGKVDISNVNLVGIETIALNSHLILNANQLNTTILTTNSTTEINEPTIIEIASTATGSNIVDFSRLGYLQSVERINISDAKLGAKPLYKSRLSISNACFLSAIDFSLRPRLSPI